VIQEKYRELPDGMEPAEVQKAFDGLFSEMATNAEPDVLDVVEALYQLADRQWHTYSVLPAEYKNRLEQWIDEHWLPTSLEFVMKVGFIAGSVGLPGVLSLLQTETRNHQLREEVRKAIVSMVEELTPKIHDPYHGMPKG